MEVSRIIIVVVAIYITAHQDTVNGKPNRCVFSGLQKVNVVLYKYAPFLLDTTNISIDSLESGKVKGITSKKLLKCFLQPCRGSNIFWNISTTKVEEELLEKLNDSGTSVAYPIPTKLVGTETNSDGEPATDSEELTTTDTDRRFVPVHGSKTQAHFVNIVNCRTDLSLLIFALIYRQWPIFTLMLLLAGIAGIIVWFLESRHDNEEFTTPFFPGGFDGFWWAFISMTTVGYGDKTPRSLTGRMFSVLWILVGITIVSFFTATITSAITIATVKNSCEQIENRTIAVLDLQKELISYIEDHGGRPEEYNSVTQMLDALNNKKNKIDSMLIDVTLANNFHHELSKKDNKHKIKKVKAVELEKPDVMFYMMIRRRKNSSWPCLKEYELDKLSTNHSRRFEYAVIEEEVVQPLSLDSPETWPFMYILGFGLVGMILLGFLLDMLLRFRRRHWSRNPEHNVCLDVVDSSAAESSAVVVYQTRHALGSLTQDMKEVKGLMQKTMERLAMIEKLVESNAKQE